MFQGQVKTGEQQPPINTLDNTIKKYNSVRHNKITGAISFEIYYSFSSIINYTVIFLFRQKNIFNQYFPF